MDNILKVLKSTIIIKPIITDKATRLLENNQYTFLVESNSNKVAISETIKTLFNVKVIKVNTCNLPIKKKRVGKYFGTKSKHKKAIITLAEGDTIPLFTEN